MTAMETATMLFAGLVMSEVIKLSIARLFKKTVDTEYMTVERCQTCRHECALARNSSNTGIRESMKELGQAMDTMRGVLLVMAVKSGVEPEELKELAYKRRSTDKS